MVVTLTEAAAQPVGNMLEKRGLGIGLRLGNMKSGSIGFDYLVDDADTIEIGERLANVL